MDNCITAGLNISNGIVEEIMKMHKKTSTKEQTLNKLKQQELREKIIERENL